MPATFQLIDFQNGIHAFDAGYVRHQLAAIHLIVDDGRAAFVDTGSNRSLPYALDALPARIDAASVDYVLLTHIHLDHAGGAGAMMAAFPNARLVVHPRGARHMIDPTKLMAATEEVYGRERARELYGELLPIPRNASSKPPTAWCCKLGQRELAFYDSPGHAKHHVFIHDRTANGIFTGDTFGISYRECDVSGRPLPDALHHAVAVRSRRSARSVERMIALDPKRLSRRTSAASPRRAHWPRSCCGASTISFALPSAQTSRRRCPADIRSAMETFLLAEARTHGVTLSDAEILSLWQMDIDLDSQGLPIWAAAG